ncbi:DUF3159 domain-containing protein [Micromonospora sp. NBC_00421]|uniref:DUF3159 domain-containing protein n=1 Tax=Micromonospora sp. NBC_00421 TaxID=2975976 RepID=UPI002E1CD2DC
MHIDEGSPQVVPERHRGSARPDDAGQATSPTILDQVGGVSGFVYSTIPVVVFVTANALLPLLIAVAVAVAVATGLALVVFRLLRGERLVSAVGSLLGVAVAVGIVAWTGSARVEDRNRGIHADRASAARCGLTAGGSGAAFREGAVGGDRPTGKAAGREAVALGSPA